jgi:ABC-type polysaccharide/polyol phosphate export permease
VLGWAWSLVNPLASALIFTAVFSFVLRVPVPIGAGGLRSYTLFLLCALLPWNFMSAVMTGGMGSLVANGNLIQKTYFPRQVLVISVATAAIVTFAIEMAVLSLLFLPFGSNPLAFVPLVIPYMLLLTLYALGIGLLLSVLNVYFRDIAHFVGLFMQIWFYATPIIYPRSLVDKAIENHSWMTTYHIDLLYASNPMVSFVEAFRDLLYQQQLPSLGQGVYLVVVTFVTVLIGLLAFHRWQGRIAEEL